MITELIFGGLILHIQPAPDPIRTGSFQKNLVIKSDRLNILVGHNSIGKPIFGLGMDAPITENFKFKLGGYIQDRSEFENLGVTIPTGDFMPIAGVELNMPVSDTVGINTLVTPFISFTGISVRF